jgi:hypothetical protein
MGRKERELTEHVSQPFKEGAPRYENIVELPNAAPAPTPEPKKVTPPSKLHAAAIAGMAICAIVGILALLARITIGWPGDSDRYVMAIFVFAGVGFLTSASIAVFSAARHTYPTQLGPEKEE